MNHIIVILGNSRTGKDTVADFLNLRGFKVHHVLDNFYSFLESYFGIDSSIRQTTEAKNVVLPGSGGVTVSDMLIGLYHWCNEQGINWTQDDFNQVTSNVDCNTVFTGVRNIHEVESLIENSYDFENDEIRYRVHTFLMEREGANGYTSDNNLQIISRYMEANSDSFTKIINSGTLEELYAIIDRLVDKLGI